MTRDLFIAPPPLKMPCPGTLLKNLDIEKKVIKIKNKLSFYLWPLVFMNVIQYTGNIKII